MLLLFYFVSDLIADWSTKAVPDVYHFVPYTYNINILINQFELVTVCNEYNWIDTSSHTPENGETSIQHLVLYHTILTYNNLRKKAFETIVEKGENAGNQHFLLFQQCFLPSKEQIVV